MMFTPKLVPSTSLTVSEMPSSAIEPFGGDEAGKAGRTLEHESHAVAVWGALEDHGGGRRHGR